MRASSTGIAASARAARGVLTEAARRAPVESTERRAAAPRQKPTRLCAPANKNGEAPDAPSHPDHLICYAAKLAKQTPKQPKLVAQMVSTANQLGAEVLRAKSLVELCVPSTATN